MMLRALPFMLVLGLVVLGTLGMLNLGEAPNAKTSLSSSKRTAPELLIAPIKGYESPALRSLGGQYVLVNFFASWCGPCAVELELLSVLPENVIVYGVAWRDKENTLLKWLADKPDAYNYIAMDQQGQTSIIYGSTGVPESFLISPEGEIVMHHAGALTPAVVRDSLLPILANSEK